MIYYTFIYSDTKEQVLEKKWKRRTTAERMMATLSRRFNRKMEIIEIEVETEEEKLNALIEEYRRDLKEIIGEAFSLDNAGDPSLSGIQSLGGLLIKKWSLDMNKKPSLGLTPKKYSGYRGF